MVSGGGSCQSTAPRATSGLVRWASSRIRKPSLDSSARALSTGSSSTRGTEWSEPAADSGAIQTVVIT